MNISSKLVFLFLVFQSLNLVAQTDTADYYTDRTIRYDDRTYLSTIRSVQLRSSLEGLSDPIIPLGGDQQLYLGFDDLEGDVKTYQFTVIHCTINWEPSNILQSDVIDGFTDQTITDYRLSRGTIQQFTHYNAVFPNENFKLRKSGNYILSVYTEGASEKPVLTKRFRIYEEKVTIDGTAHAATIIGDRNYKQEIDFTIHTSGSSITNPFAELTVIVQQNGRSDNAVVGLKPQFLRDQDLVYDYEDGNVFKAGNEFRVCDIRSLRTPAERVQKMEIVGKTTQVYMLPDEKRAFKRYSSSQDINGRFLIHTFEGSAHDVDADYAYVHFFLPWDFPEKDGNIFVFGGLSDWQCRPEYRMTYNAERKGYEATLFLKQGYYNYEYVFLKDGEKAADDFLVEGMHSETENMYTIYVYHRSPGALTEELIGVRQVRTRN
ncbi:MAG: DUF5103 domain-containing protein [Bacteroidia bacterium]